MALYEQATDFEAQSKPDSALLFYDRAIEADPAYHYPILEKQTCWYGKMNFIKRWR